MAKGSTINVRILGDNSDLKRALGDSDSKLSGWAKGAGKLVAVGIGAAAVAAGAGIAASVNQAVNLGESTNAVEVTFGKQAEGIKKLGEQAATSLGLSNSEFNGLAVQFSSFADKIAGPSGDVVGTMDDLTTRAADFASVMNLDVNDAAAAFQSGLSGEAEPLKKFGIDMSAAAVEAAALANGIGDGIKPLTEAQKVQARYALIMEQTEKTAGDFANTSDSLANRQRVLSATVKDLGAKVGTALLPILTRVATVVAEKVVPAIERHLPAAIAVLQSIVGAVAGFIQDHWGKVAAAFTGSIAAVRGVVEFFANNLPVLAGVAVLIGGALIAALVAWSVATYAQVTALYAQAAAFVIAHAPVIAIIAAIALLVAGVVYAYQNFEIFRNVVNAVKDFILDDLIPAFKSIWSFIDSKIIPIVKAVVETYIAALILQFKAIKAVITEVVIPAFSAVVGFITGTVVPGVQKIATKIAEVASAVGTKVGEIVGFITGIPGRISAVVSTLWDGIRTGITKAKTWVGDRVDEMVGFITGMPGRLLELVSDFAGAGLELGAAIVRGIVDGISGAASFVGNIGSAVAEAVGAAAKTAANAVIDRVNSALEFKIEGPGFLPDISLNPPDIPRFHTGGIIQGSPRRETPILAMPGEGVFTREQMAAMGGGGGGGNVYHITIDGAVNDESTLRVFERRLDQIEQRRRGAA